MSIDERKATEILIMTQEDIDQDRDLRNDKMDIYYALTIAIRCTEMAYRTKELLQDFLGERKE